MYSEMSSLSITLIFNFYCFKAKQCPQEKICQKIIQDQESSKVCSGFAMHTQIALMGEWFHTQKQHHWGVASPNVDAFSLIYLLQFIIHRDQKTCFHTNAQVCQSPPVFSYRSMSISLFIWQWICLEAALKTWIIY